VKDFIDVFGRSYGRDSRIVKPRAAVRAVGERILISPVGRIEKHRQGIPGHVAISGRINALLDPVSLTGPDLEATEGNRIKDENSRL